MNVIYHTKAFEYGNILIHHISDVLQLYNFNSNQKYQFENIVFILAQNIPKNMSNY